MENFALSQVLFQHYNEYLEKSFTNRFFKHSLIVKNIEKYLKNPYFSVFDSSMSVQEREIFAIKVGKGETKILLWSQMHGDEPTATQAIFDIFNFLSQNDELNFFREKIFENLSLYFVPMLNPDGAEKFKRTNALNIDLNRDALSSTSPESKFLKNLHAKIQPEICFNLHDQAKYYAVGKTKIPAAMSFLAPSFDEERNINENRAKAMKLIAKMSETLHKFIPQKISRYSDEYLPIAFGDFLQTSKSATILIESGFFHKDNEKQFIRKLNFVAILMSFDSIISKYFENEKIEKYFDIPLNKKEGIFDVILRNAKIQTEKEIFTADISFNKVETYDVENQCYTTKDVVANVGDLSNFGAYFDIDAKDFSPIFYENLELEKETSLLKTLIL